MVKMIRRAVEHVTFVVEGNERGLFRSGKRSARRQLMPEGYRGGTGTGLGVAVLALRQRR